MVFYSQGGQTAKVRFRWNGVTVTLSTGVRDVKAAERRAAWLRTVRGDGETWLLEALAARRLTLAVAYERRHRLKDLKASLDDRRLHPLLAEWIASAIQGLRSLRPAGRGLPAVREAYPYF